MEYVTAILPFIPWMIGALFVLLFVRWIFSMRRIVPPNTVHIVQSQNTKSSYGVGGKSGNAYLQWPSYLPVLGVTVIDLPVNNFDLQLKDYVAYDKDRVPLLLDIAAFFRIEDTATAASRVSNFQELVKQLHYVVQGAARKILATHDIHNIMLNRATFGDQFTSEVAEQLKAWGVVPVKNIELMDIRDVPPAPGQKAHGPIENIKAQKTSQIEMESRVVVAQNMQKAAEAEINAQREVDMRKQEAIQTVGQRTAQQEQAVGIAKEQAKQEVQSEAKTTAQREMEVVSVKTQRAAEIKREAAIVQAEEVQRTTVIHAEGEKQQTILAAEAGLEEARRNAEGIRAEGEAKGAAEQAMLMAPVNAQKELAVAIGENQGYQTYLINIRQVEANQAVGIEQAKALADAEIKVIANAGGGASGFGQAIGAVLEGLANTEVGGKVLSSVAKLNAGTEMLHAAVKTSPAAAQVSKR